jgi:hypothetical protein
VWMHCEPQPLKLRVGCHIYSVISGPVSEIQNV